MSIMQMLLGAVQSGYNLLRSVRLRSSASGYLNRTPASAGTGLGRTWTWSGWLKRGKINDPNIQMLLSASSSRSGFGFFTESGGGTGSDSFSIYHNAAFSSRLQTTQVFRDPSAWYHIIVSVDTTQATASDRIKIYVNGTQVTQFSSATYPAQNYQFGICQNTAHNIGRDVAGVAYYFDGYLAETYLIDGQALTPSSFGAFSPITGVWQPARYTGTYGTNGFYLPFTDNSTAAALGTDFSGNSNTWTVNNISVTAGVTYDSMTDVPTLTSATAANYCVWNPLENEGSLPTFSNGNLDISGLTVLMVGMASLGLSYQKWYWEITVNTSVAGVPQIGIAKEGIGTISTNGLGQSANAWTYLSNANKGNANSFTSYGATYAVGDVIGVAFDADIGSLTFYKNGVSQGQAFTGLTSGPYFPAFGGSSGSNAVACSANFGQRPFAYTPPTGFVALNTFNLAASTIVKGNLYFDTSLYTGNGSTQTVTNSGSMQPDFVWIKSRSGTTWNNLYDSVRGVNKALYSNDTFQEFTDTNLLTSFNSNGFSIGNSTVLNTSAATYVAWQWQAGQGSSSSNTNGTITSTVSVNASAGFSVVTYTGTGANATVGHGLGVAPKMIIVKNRNSTFTWRVYHASLANTQVLYLSATDAATTETASWNSTTPAATVFSVGTGSGTNGSTLTYVAYCFAEIAGFSKFGSYTGNGNADGPFVYTGFRPAFVLIKESSASGNNWQILDDARNTYNVAANILQPNASNAETAFGSGGVDFLSNGFKLRTSSTSINASSSTVIYAAFAENPFKNSLAR